MTVSIEKFPELQVLLAAGHEVMLEKNGLIVARVARIPNTYKRPIAGLLRGQIRVSSDFDETPSEMLDLMLHGDVFPKG